MSAVEVGSKINKGLRTFGKQGDVSTKVEFLFAVKNGNLIGHQVCLKLNPCAGAAIGKIPISDGFMLGIAGFVDRRRDKVLRIADQSQIQQTHPDKTHGCCNEGVATKGIAGQVNKPKRAQCLQKQKCNVEIVREVKAIKICGIKIVEAEVGSQIPTHAQEER